MGATREARDPVNRVREMVSEDEPLNQDKLVEHLTDDGLEQDEVLGAIRSLMVENQVSYDDHWDLQLE